MNFFSNPIYGLIIIVILLSVLVLVFRKFNIPVPYLGKKPEYFSFDIIDESGNESYHKINIKDIKRIGKKVYFNYNKQGYFIMKGFVTRRNKLPYSRYNEGTPIPLQININQQINMSAQEVTELADTKVAIDLLHFSLAGEIGKLYLIIAALGIGLGVINLYLIYNLGNEISGENILLQQVVHYLFPNGTPTG